MHLTTRDPTVCSHHLPDQRAEDPTFSTGCQIFHYEQNLFAAESYHSPDLI